jgi:hypothetical protein
MAMLSAALLLSNSSVISSPWGISRIPRTIDAPAPSLRFVRFIVRDDRQYAVIELSNPTQKSIFFYGYGPEYPQQWYQRRVKDNWRHSGWHWCGTGMELHELAGESLLEFKIGVFPEEEWHFGGYDDGQPFRVEAPLRVSVKYGWNGEDPERDCWTESIPFDPLPAELLDELNKAANPTGGGFF